LRAHIGQCWGMVHRFIRNLVFIYVLLVFVDIFTPFQLGGT
jgi:hypothetical protein